MKNLLFVILTVALTAAVAFGQKKTTATIDPAVTARETADAAVKAHGGDKLTAIKTLVMRGSASINVFGQNQTATFYTAISGDKYVLEIQNPFQPLKQSFDGKNTSSSLQGFSLPPVTSIGFPVLSRIGQTGFAVSALTDTKRRKGFRVTTPDGYYTDFIVNDKSGQIKSYESSYEVSGRVVTTSVEIDSVETVEGIVIPKNYSQRFDLGGMVAYVGFKSREILVNSTIDESIFTGEN